ncbi:hypothetical protein V8C86DRAFT_3021735 [Haematococcus lacustris]
MLMLLPAPLQLVGRVVLLPDVHLVVPAPLQLVGRVVLLPDVHLVVPAPLQLVGRVVLLPDVHLVVPAPLQLVGRVVLLPDVHLVVPAPLQLVGRVVLLPDVHLVVPAPLQLVEICKAAAMLDPFVSSTVGLATLQCLTSSAVAPAAQMEGSFDLDGDGTISRTELHRVLASAGIPISHADKHTQEGEGGAISFNEFRRLAAFLPTTSQGHVNPLLYRALWTTTSGGSGYVQNSLTKRRGQSTFVMFDMWVASLRGVIRTSLAVSLGIICLSVLDSL